MSFRLSLLVLVACLSGCCSISCKQVGDNPLDDMSEEDLYGHYTLSYCSSDCFQIDNSDLLNDDWGNRLFQPTPDSVSVSIAISHSESRTDMSVFQGINSAISIFTFFAWVGSCSEQKDYRIEIAFPNQTEVEAFTIDACECFSLTPLAWLTWVFRPTATSCVIWDNSNIQKPIIEQHQDAYAKKIAIEILLSKLSKERWRQLWQVKANNARPHRESVLREFALREAPSIWRAVQDLRGEIATMESKLAKVKGELLEFNRDPASDSDYQELCALLEKMKSSQETIWDKLETAYLSHLKFRATPGRREYEETMRKALNDGIREAEAVTRQFDKMSRDK